MKAPSDLTVAELVYLLGLEPLDSSLVLGPEQRQELGLGSNPRHAGSRFNDIDSALGFSSFDTLIAPGESRRFETRPQLPFTPYFIAIPRTVSVHFQLDDVRVRLGKSSWLSLVQMSAGPIPCETMSLLKLGASEESRRVDAECSMYVTNIDKEPHIFRAALLGTHHSLDPLGPW
jgi:hypothetical protein